MSAAVACGFLAQHANRAFLRWATAFAGAGLALAVLGQRVQSHNTRQDKENVGR